MSDKWFYQRAGTIYDPVTAAELRALVESDGILPDDLIWPESIDPVAAVRAEAAMVFPARAPVEPEDFEPAPTPLPDWLPALAAVEGSDAPDAVPVLMQALRVNSLDDKEQAAQRDRAAEALGKIGEPAIRPLVDALETDFFGGGSGTKGKINADARLAAVKALGAIGGPADTAKVMTLLNRLARFDSSDAVRDAAKEARTRIRKSGN